MSIFTPLLRTANQRERGPSPSFTPAHLVLTFLVIGDAGLLGRQTLARKVGLGDGAVRTVLRKLKDGGFVQVGASGCALTNEGAQAYGGIRQKITMQVELAPSTLTVGDRQFSIVVREAGPEVKGGIEQRDAAIKAGAFGATTYVIQGSKFTVPGGSSDCERDFPSGVWKELKGKLNPAEGDAVIVCGSNDQIASTLGSLAAALTLV